MFLPVHLDEDDNSPGAGQGWDNRQDDPLSASTPATASAPSSSKHNNNNNNINSTRNLPPTSPSLGSGNGRISRNVDLKAALGLLTDELRYQCGQGLLADVRVLQLCLVGIRVVMEKDAALLLDEVIHTDVALFAGT